MKTQKIPELNIEVETEISQKGKSFSELIIPKGWRLLKAEEIIFLFNNYKKELNMEDTWEFIEQPFNLNKNNDYVAGFGAGSGWTGLSCGGHPDGSDPSLGVRFCRNIEDKQDYKKLYFELKKKFDKIKELI